MKNILAFGDSNTWGLIPGTKERYPGEVRWTGLVQNKLDDTKIIEEGLCGRTTVFEDEIRPFRKGVDTLPLILESASPLDGVIIMLGTNDCKAYYNANPHIIGKGLERCIEEIEKYVSPEKVLVVSPIYLGDDVWKPSKDPEFDTASVTRSKELADTYRRIAERRGNRFLAASSYAKASKRDDEHLDERGHEALAEAISEKIEAMQI
ncbi:MULTISPECIES: GDSL-type esterase/lipase family protein [unclassified Butyrivibrio]|uniref:GDSL-type esterase/lipase family protein n=1 Tax=unclassified Butyrivibrio TaxID=2639466 RepID=UPI0008E6F880|nr:MULTISPECIES: GDSL-type esterase/lipase family protein [unclassified Butyrivibrio]RKM60186.1 arylesterase [Butyrivibrio sp. XB500-5]SFU55284.1 Lysophospholipase L1 [Butyrivibrio sp. INlla21]